MEDTVCPEQLQEDLACQAILGMSSSVSPSRSIPHPVVILPVDDAELAREQSSHLQNPVAKHPSTERSQLLNLSKRLAENIPPQAQPYISPPSSPCPPIQHRTSSPSISQHLSIITAEIRRGVKRRRPDDDDDDEDYQPHRTHKRAASSQARLNARKPRKGGLRSSKRAMKHEEASEERFECSMVIHGCTKSFTRKNDMERHMRSCKFNPDLRSMAVKCPHCQKTLSRKDALLRHIKQSHVEV